MLKNHSLARRARIRYAFDLQLRFQEEAQQYELEAQASGSKTNQPLAGASSSYSLCVRFTVQIH